MTETITFRLAGSEAETVVASLNPKQIREDIFEVTLPLRDPETARIFGSEARLATHGWFIAFRTIRRHYSKTELAASHLVHANPIRVFPEGMDEPNETYEFDPDCRGRVPVRQIAPIVLTGALKCKDALVRLSDGAWACRLELVQALLATELEQPALTPIFASRGRFSRWLEGQGAVRDREVIGPRLEGPIGQFQLSEGEIDQFEWLQIHPSVGFLNICPPTDGRYAPYQDPKPDNDNGCKTVYGQGLVSELYLECAKDLSGDWFQTQQFIGGIARGVFLPARPLVVSQRCFHFLNQFRLHNIQFECIHLVGAEL